MNKSNFRVSAGLCGESSLLVVQLFAPTFHRSMPISWNLSGTIRHPDVRLRAYWWWINGNVTKQSITRDLEQMRPRALVAH